MASKSLALAILERSLEAYLAEEASSGITTDQNQKQDHPRKENDDDDDNKEEENHGAENPNDVSTTTTTTTTTTTSSAGNTSTREINDNDDTDRMHAPDHNEDVTTESSQQSTRHQNRMKRRRLLAEKDGGGEESGDEGDTIPISHTTSVRYSSDINDDDGDHDKGDGDGEDVSLSTPAINSNSNTDGKQSFSKQHPTHRRFELFFAAGGLRILNQWLADASSYETKTTTTTTNPSSNNRTAARSNRTTAAATTKTKITIRKASATRPLTLSILHFLEHIPFEKKTVMNSKINKQIKKLGKKIKTIQEKLHQHKKQTTGSAEDIPNLEEDLECWTTQPSIPPETALAQIKVAIDAVKASWREKAKVKGSSKKTTKTTKRQVAAAEEGVHEQAQIKSNNDPFGALKSKIRERLQVLTQFETGVLPEAPEWYRPMAAVAATSKKKKLVAGKERKEQSRNESEIERLRLEKKIKQVQSRSQKSLQQLRERLRQRNTKDHGNGSNKKVTWKDGLKGQVTRNRKKLEEVFVFGEGYRPSVARFSGENNLLVLDPAASMNGKEG